MGCCFSDVAAGQAAVGGAGAASYQSNPADGGPNDAVDYFFTARGYRGLFSRIEISLSASNLRDRDLLSKSDPMAVVYTKGRDGALQELGRTEVVLNSLNPKWIRKHTVTYYFEVVQTLVFRVYDVDTQFDNVDVKMLKLDEQQFLGEATCALSEIVTKSNRSVTLDLVCKNVSVGSNRPRNLGALTVHAEELVNSKTTTELILRCSDLESRNMFSKSDPFLVISKIVESGISIPICKTEVLKNDLYPVWKSVFLNIQQVGSKDSPLIIECFNFNSNGRHDLLGKVQKSLADLEKLCSVGHGEHLFLPTAVGHTHQNKVLKSQLFVDKFSESVQHSFLDYLSGGCELNFMVAIDFTASNGNPRLPDSLHYIDPSGRPNAYQRAILEVGEVLQFYNSDKSFPAWGFGARPIDGPVSHCFNLNGSSTYCEVEGVQGIMTAYTGALFNVSLAGPTLFGPVISIAAQIAGQSLANDELKYFVLLIITDGVITDLQETKDALVKASDLPLSILIVGVGGADFKEMEILDADKGERLESSNGRVASRDIVQFVPMRDVQSGEFSVVQSLLAELPSQFLTYMRTRDWRESCWCIYGREMLGSC
ncbi:protein BONZAI 1-like isoform X1 [Camellia sinensis]|uniref:protein BONZAI 1-like isoform X1 n=2 Tax=Camellia sinensis TaxID=4442 RepID=UPI001035D234|nr:protein BONZAI 1-like isoform X1 [Camellia sinensis]